MPSLRSLFVTFTAVVACVTGAAAHAPQTTPHNTLIPRGTVYDPRCDCFVKPLPVVIDQATEQIKPLVDQLKSLTAEECTVEKIRPIADEIKGVIVEGVSQLTLLAKGNVEVELVLSTGNGTISVSEVATVLAGLVNLVLGGFAVVLKLIVSSKSSEVITIFADVCITLSHFLSISVTLVGGLLELVTPLIKDSLQVVVQLGIVSVFKFTGLDFTKTCEIGVGVAAGEFAGSFIDVLKTAFHAIQPLADKLRTLSASEATAFTIQPIVAEIRTILITCISQVGALLGQEKEVILLREGKVLAVADAAGCVGELVLILFDGICEVIKKVSITESKVVVGLFVDVGLLVAQLIKISAEVVTFDGGIIALLKPIIKEAFGLAITLGITDCYDFLEIDWTHYGGSLGVSVGAGVAVTSTLIGTATTVLGGGFTTHLANPTVGVTTVTGPATTFVTTIALPTPTHVGGESSNDNDDDLEDCDEEEQDGDSAPGHGTGNGNDDSEEDCDDEDESNTPGNSGSGSGTTSPGTGGHSNNGGSNNDGGNSGNNGSHNNGGSNNGGGSSNTGESNNGGGSNNGGNDSGKDTPANGGNTGNSGGNGSNPGNNGGNSGSGNSGNGNGGSGNGTTTTPSGTGSASSPACTAGPNGQVSVSLVAVVQECQTKVTVLAEKLKKLSSEECTEGNVKPVVAEIKEIFIVAIEQIKVFIGASATVVLASDCSGATLSVSAFASIFATLINLIFGAITIVIKTASSENQKVLISIFADLCITISVFIKTCCEIVIFEGGLIAVLTPLIQTSIGICVTLGIKTSFEFLQIDWTKIVVEIGVGLGASVSIVTIVNNATTIITPLIEKLGSLNGDDCNAANITPIVAEIKAVFTVCIAQIQVLVGAGAEVVLANGGSVISIGECGKLVGGLINLVFGACGSILKIVVSADYKVVLGLFVDLGITIGAFIKTSCDVVVFEGGLTAILAPIVKGSLGICVTLGIKEHFEFLGIDWTSIGAGVGVGATVSIITIVGNCTQSITPLVQKLKDLKAEDCTAATIGPIVGEIKGIFSITIEQVKVLAGASIEVILANGYGAVVSVGECGKIIGDLINLIFVTITAVLKIVVEAEAKAVIGIFGELAIVVGVFIQTCHSVVTVDGGLIQVLLPIIKTSLGACIQLDVTSHFGFLQIDFTQLAIDLGITVGVGAGVGASGSIITIITELTAQVKPLIDQLTGLKAGDCGADRVGELVGQIKVVLVASTEKIKALGSVQVSIDEVSGLITALLQLIFGGVTAVLKIVTVGHAKAVFGMCAELGVTVGALLHACTGAVGGLETAICSQINSTLSATFTTILKLDISSSFGFLGVDLSSVLGVKTGGVLSTLLQGAGF